MFGAFEIILFYTKWFHTIYEHSEEVNNNLVINKRSTVLLSNIYLNIIYKG